MSDLEADKSAHLDVSLPYLHDFRLHVSYLQEHLRGQVSESEHWPLQPSFIPPSSYWTSGEKDAFFHALSIYSRFRPDLIAACIKTKNTLDVYLYLETLEVAASRIPKDENLRNAVEPAMEMSKTWIALEERNASSLNDPSKHDDHSDGALVTGGKNFIEVELMVMETMLRGPVDNLADIDAIPEEIPTAPQAHSDTEEELPSSPSSANDGFPSLSNSISRLSSPDESIQLSESQTRGEEGETLSTKLSPSSRRRLLKRLYMRRQRAIKHGRHIDAISVKLRPGRKVKPRKPPKPRPRSYNVPSDFSDAGSSDGSYAQGNKGGLTTAYWYKEHLLESGVNADTLQKESLDFFHLSTVGKLINLYFSGYRSGTLGGAESISADVIRLLTEIAIEFTTEILHRAIIISEQEKQMKGNIRVWKQNHDQITVESIKLALEMMGVKTSTKEAYFTQLFQEELPEFELNEKGNNTVASIQSCQTSQRHELFNPLSLHHELYPPQLYLPTSYGSLEDSVSIDNTEEGDEFQQKRVKEVMEEERKLDHLDMEVSKLYEDNLWNHILQF